MTIFISCSEESLTSATDNSIRLENYSDQNVSIFDARIRSINSENFVKELYLVNLGDEEIAIGNMYIQGFQYSDNGKGNDLVASDGIFTSTELFNHDREIQFDERNLIRSVLEKPIVSLEFTQNDELLELIKVYPYRDISEQTEARFLNFTCDIVWSSSPSCNACDWYDLCDYCVTITGCSIGLGF